MYVCYWSKKHLRSIVFVTVTTAMIITAVTLIIIIVIFDSVLLYIHSGQLYLVEPILPDLPPDFLDNVRKASQLVQDTVLIIYTLQQSLHQHVLNASSSTHT